MEGKEQKSDKKELRSLASIPSLFRLMKRFLKKQRRVFALLLAFLATLATGYSFNHLFPDEIIMKDGTHYKGLIVKNDAIEVVLQQEQGEHVIPKAAIARIDDVSKSALFFTDLVAPDKAPPWRMMVQDMRCNDAVKSFIQIPAARISEGYLKNVPYLSFHINKDAEMNIYGDPKNPACVEFGTFSKGERLQKFQEVTREFFAGYLSSRAEIKTLYSLNFKGDEQSIGKFVFKIMPPKAPGSEGAWWISIYDPISLEKARLSDADYKKLTLPANQVRKHGGILRYDLEALHLAFLNSSMKHWFGKLPTFHGFYRNQNNKLKVMKRSI